MQPGHEALSRYLKVMLSVTLALSLLPFATLAFFGKNINIPPPRVSDSISFNEKALWLRSRIRHGCDILAIGSSMTLNNLSSSAVNRRLPGKTFINASSWGLTVRQSAMLLELLEDYCQPEQLVIVSSPVDFRLDDRPDRNYSNELSRCLLDGCPLLLVHARGFILDYYLDNLFNIAGQRQERDRYDSLDFDPGGGVPFADSGFPINAHRWTNTEILAPPDMDERNYAALYKLAGSLHDKGIRLILVQSPVRKVLANESIMNSLAAHWQRMADIADSTGAMFLNLGLNPRFTDVDFVDAGHLKASGAESFTNLIIDAMEP